MNKSLITALLTLIACTTQAQRDENFGHNVLANHQYHVYVYENERPIDITRGRGLAASRSTFAAEGWKQLRNSYANTALGLFTSTSQNLLAGAVNLLVDAVRSKKSDWQQQLRNDCRFTKTLLMQNTITDFYGSTSTRGALDPDSIIFNGFACQQDIAYKVKRDGREVNATMPVLQVRCSLRDDDHGLMRMLNHGKFEVQVDSVRIDPAVCNLPNDSLTERQLCYRTPFDFQRRKNLRLQLEATFSSSWVNEAIMVTTDQQLGTFTVTIAIPDSTYLCHDGGVDDGCFVFHRLDSAAVARLTKDERDDYERRAACVSVVGDCFLVPRSFIGSSDMQTYAPVWGTGQYKVDMTLTETCDINDAFYHEAAAHGAQPGRAVRWNDQWKDEWRRMKHRRRSQPLLKQVANEVVMQYADGKWLGTLLSPVSDVLLDGESKYLKKVLPDWATSSTTATTSATSGGSMPVGDKTGNPTSKPSPSSSGNDTTHPTGGDMPKP